MLDLAANDPLIKTYLHDLQRLKNQSVTRELALRGPFQTLLDKAAKKRGWTLVPELSTYSGGKRVVPDGTVRDEFRLARGWWEAKDTSDRLASEIQKKIKAGYPTRNTIFEDTQTAVLYQDRGEAGEFTLREPLKVAELNGRKPPAGAPALAKAPKSRSTSPAARPTRCASPTPPCISVWRTPPSARDSLVALALAVALLATEVLCWRKQRQFDAGPPLEPSVKRDQRIRVRFGKSCQVGIRPGTRSNAGAGHEFAPGRFDTVRLNREDQSPISTQLRKGLPCLDDSPWRSSHHIGVRQQTKQPHLGDPAESDGSGWLCGESVARRHMVNVALSGQGDPDVDIRQGDDHPIAVRPHPGP